MVKSPEFLDPVRLEVEDVSVRITQDHEQVLVTVTLAYSPWEPSRAQDQFMEQGNALECVRQVLRRGGVGDEGW